MTSGPGPRFSLVIPLQDEEASVEALLASIAAQTLLPEEVILVDAGSQDETVARARQSSDRLRTAIVGASRVYPGVARNLGAASARGEWLGFTDGGIQLDPHWLEELSRAIEPGVDAVFGTVEPICDSFFRECAAITYVSARKSTGIRAPFVASSVVSRRAFEAVGGFPPYRAAEDLVFMEEIRKRFAFREVPSAVVHWQIAGSAIKTFRRFAEYSFHNLAAGRGRHWHLGVVRLYSVLGLSMGSAVLLGLGTWSTSLLPAFFISRALKAAWLKRRSFGFRTLRVSRVAGAAALLALIDAATALGAARWLWSVLAGEQPYGGTGDGSPPVSGSAREG
jgi:glycosyltransferase involved in cell wall biosynthesis